MWLVPSARNAIRLQFALIAFSVGLWAFRIGEFKNAIGFSHAQLSWLLIITPLALTVTVIYVPRIARKIGIMNLLITGSSIWSIATIGLSLFPSLGIIIVLLMIMGSCAAFFEVGLGTVAQKLDRDTGPIISSSHGFWSIGFALGGFVSSVFSDKNISFFHQQLILVPIIIALTFAWSKPLPHPRTIADDNHGHTFPSLAILPLCLIPVAGLFIEGAIADWNSVFLLDELNWSDLATGAVFAGFMGAMAVTRLLGDSLRSKYSAKSLLTTSTIMSVIGMMLYALGGNFALVFIGAIIAGAGAGNVYPLALVIANIGRDEEDASQIIGSLALVSFTAFLAAPVFMGWIGHAFSLSLAFTLTVPLLALTFLWMKLAKV